MEKKVCVITGGGSGMGLAAARELGKTHKILIAGRNAGKLEVALDDLRRSGIEAEAMACDVALRQSTDRLALHAATMWSIAAVLNAAGMSPHMGTARDIMAANALKRSEQGAPQAGISGVDIGYSLTKLAAHRS